MDLILSPIAIKQLKKIGSKEHSKVERKLGQLIDHPLLGKPLHGKLSGTRSLRAWPLRIIYQLNLKKKIVEIIDIDYRGDVYK
jgi:mRNA-degrading endonuclease RelE of RelBE toxin-antitoxin system